MKNKFFSKKPDFSKVPVGVSGLGLGVGGLGNSTSAFLNSNFVEQYWNISKSGVETLETIAYIIQGILIFITLICFVLILMKYIFNFDLIKKELSDPLASSYLPTQAMCLASLAYFVGTISIIGKIDPNNPYKMILNAGTVIATSLDFVAICFHLVLLIGFFLNVIKKHSIKNDAAYSSWFVPTCGIALSCGFEPKLGYLIPNEFYQATWYFGFASLILFLPYMAYKHFFFNLVSDDKLPSMAIYLAAPNLLLNGMLSIFPEKAYYSNFYISFLAIILFGFSFMGILFYGITFYRCSKLNFNPGYAAFTFPMAISSLATIKFSEYIFKVQSETIGETNDFVSAFHAIIFIFGFILLLIAIVIIFYILLRYIVFFFIRKNVN